MKLLAAILCVVGLSGCVVYDEPVDYPVVYYGGYYGYWHEGVFIRGYPPVYAHYYRGRYHYHSYHHR